jgi:type IV pilus assembly protein PilM
MNFLEQAKSLLQTKVLKKSQSSVLGIDMGASSIKLVQLKNEQGTAVLETYGEIALGPFANTEVGQATNLPPEKLAPALKDLMKEAGVTSTSCGVSVPFSASLVKLIEVPPLDVDKLKTVIPIEARKYIPVPINEVQFDYFLIPETEQKLFLGARSTEEAASTELQSRMVLLVAMPNEVLRKY